MSEEVYRPERRAIDPNALSNQENLNKVSQVRRAVQEETETAPSPIRNIPNVPNNLNNGDNGLQIKGRVPEEFAAAIQSNNSPSPVPAQNLTPPAARPKTQSNMQLEQILAALQSKSTTYEQILLPSRGRFYNGNDGPTDGVLNIRPMTGEEEQILATPRFVKRGQAINMIFNKCIRDGFNSENLLDEDAKYVLIYLRGISYTPDYDIEVTCPSCSRKFRTTIDLNDLHVEACPDNFDFSKLEDTLPTSGLQFKYRLATSSDEQKIQEYRDRRAKAFDLSNQADDTLQYRTAMLLDNIAGISDKNELQLILKNLTANDLSYLRSVITEPPFGVETKIEISCASCMQDFEIELPMETSFFFPKARKKN